MASSGRHVETFSKYLPTKLSDKERLERGIEIGEQQEKLQNAEDEFKAVKSTFDGQKKRITERIKELGDITRTGFEERSVDCQRRFDYMTNRVVEFRLDTLEEISSREMNSVERQMYFNFIVGSDSLVARTEGSDEDDSTGDKEPHEPTEEEVIEAASFNDVEWKYKEEVAGFKAKKLNDAIKEFSKAEQTPECQMKLRILRDEFNRRNGMEPNEFGVYKEFPQAEVLTKEGEGWRVAIQTLYTPAGWIRSYAFYTQHNQSSGEALTANQIFIGQAEAIMDAAFQIKKAMLKDSDWSPQQKKMAKVIARYADEVIAAQQERLDEGALTEEEREKED